MQDSGTSITPRLVATRGATERALYAIRQLIGPRGRSIALATLAISPFATPAAAQSGSEAVVCVGSERQTLATNPILSVYPEAMENVYGIGTGIGQARLSRARSRLRTRFLSARVVHVARSRGGRGVIVSYAGIRQDLTVDPTDRRSQALSVGLARSFEAGRGPRVLLGRP